MLLVIIPVGVEISSVLCSLLGCGLLLLTMAVTMSTVTVSVTSVSMTMVLMLVFVHMSVSMTCDGLNVLHVYALLLQGRVLIFGVGGLTPLEGGSLLCPMGVTVTMIMGVAVTPEHEGQEECDTQGEYQPHSGCCTYSQLKAHFSNQELQIFQQLLSIKHSLL